MTADPVVAALAQLVRERHAKEQREARERMDRRGKLRATVSERGKAA